MVYASINISNSSNNAILKNKLTIYYSSFVNRNNI